ncbi:MAG: hypothetical protein QOD92_1870 [Acidimicrobiaceae bacterium]|jgi:hypothetical protein
MRRTIAFAVIVVIAVSSGRAASAQQAPVVNVSETTAMGVHQRCQTEPTTTPGSFTLERSNTSGSLTVTYHISGGPTDLNSDAVAGDDHTVEFLPGEATATVVVHPAIDATDATVAILDDQPYEIGDPAQGVVTVDRQADVCATAVDLVPAPTSTLARTGVRSTTGSLALVGITALTLGSVLLVLSSRRKATGVR